MILHRPSPDVAPFEISIQLPSGQSCTLLCYAFLANKYGQRGRPDDEHRFQIKYGGDLSGYHDIYIDSARSVITLFFGVHLEEGVFVAVDPAMHNPTRFSKSVEVKTADIESAKKSGWYGLERERSRVRRILDMPLSYQTESVLIFDSDNFLRYIELERLATGLDPGERLLLIDRMSRAAEPDPAAHPLELQTGLTARQILDVIWGAFRLQVAVRGGVAEYHLERYLKSLRGIDSVQRLDEDGRPDFEISSGGRAWFIECKNVLRRSSPRGPRVDFQKTRAAKGDPCSRYYSANSFDVLAACLHPVTERWEFRFCRTGDLASHPRCPGRLSERVLIDDTSWRADLLELV